MIKFFRRIRQRLLSENKFSKYVIYALGEIILVVIGILIALQINNWNEQRKQNQLEIVYIDRLHNELSKDIITFSNEIQRLERNNEKIIKFTNALKDDIQNDSLFVTLTNEFMIFGTTYPMFNPSTSTFEDLSSTGNLSVISNTEIRDSIVKHYEDYQFVELNFKLDYDWATPIDAPLFTQTDALKFDTDYTSILFPNTTKENLANEIIKNKNIFLRNAALHFWMNKDCIIELRRIKEKTKEICALLKIKKQKQ
ncbi:DUF6090 family protein [Litoribaculum gwangyangense]|uniref:Uncharacterized protein n=1 Tax=Litoribaculum gwangyangense TaxID=1130722 RepID=A0ABP9CDY3_9FLAO